MIFKEIAENSFTVVGIAIRTCNKNNQAQIDIAKLWGDFMQNGIASKIPNKVSDDIFCIYTDYESDWQGEYTTILGCKVSSIENITEGLICKEIPSTKYRLYKSEGEIPKCVGETWIHIWQSTDIPRAYVADFDVYSQTDTNVVSTYLSVK